MQLIQFTDHTVHIGYDKGARTVFNVGGSVSQRVWLYASKCPYTGKITNKLASYVWDGKSQWVKTVS
jgi:hypothetical protein